MAAQVLWFNQQYLFLLLKYLIDLVYSWFYCCFMVVKGIKRN